MLKNSYKASLFVWCIQRWRDENRCWEEVKAKASKESDKEISHGGQLSNLFAGVCVLLFVTRDI